MKNSELLTYAKQLCDGEVVKIGRRSVKLAFATEPFTACGQCNFMDWDCDCLLCLVCKECDKRTLKECFLEEI